MSSKSQGDDADFIPGFDLGEFRHLAARYCRHLIQARLLAEPNFLSQRSLARWDLAESTRQDPWTIAQLLRLAALDLDRLNREFLPRCGSGGVAITDLETPVGRLIEKLAFLVDPSGGGPAHNGALLELAQRSHQGEAIAWENVFDARQLSAIRDDLDRLPHPGRHHAHLNDLSRNYRLLVVEGESRREAWSLGREIRADWTKQNRAWKLLVELVRKARVGQGIAVTGEREGSIRGARTALREILDPGLYELIKSRDGNLRLHLSSNEVGIMRFETRDYVVEF